MREPWLVLVPTWARADGLCGTPDMSPALNYKALLYATPTHLPSICPFTRPHVIISALSMHLPPVLWAWIRAPATHFLGARILTTLPLSIPPAAFSALPQHLPSPFSVIILSSQYLFQRGPIWIRELTYSTRKGSTFVFKFVNFQSTAMWVFFHHCQYRYVALIVLVWKLSKILLKERNPFPSGTEAVPRLNRIDGDVFQVSSLHHLPYMISYNVKWYGSKCSVVF